MSPRKDQDKHVSADSGIRFQVRLNLEVTLPHSA